MSKDKNFRKDIAGLRALAVMLVLLCHFKIPGFGFGFIGVDIFFVISGFLITRLLYKDFVFSNLENPEKSYLSFSHFYLRRIRRLLPAAVTVILLVNVISFFLYNPQSRDELIGNSKWALLFFANVAFLRSETNYFQQNSEPSMLQHYWSLSVEEQFYFVWPILFLVAASFHRIKFRGNYFRFDKRILTLIFTVTLLSYIFLQFGFEFAPTEVYFSIFTRAWELGVGAFFGVLAFHKRQEMRFSKIELFAPLVATYFLSSVLITEDNWGRLIIAPVVVTGFFLYAGQDQPNLNPSESSVSRIVRRTYLFIGDISYSLYLVHWPIFIITSHLNLITQLTSRILLLPISITFGFILWKFVEIPCQNVSLPKRAEWEQPAFNFVKQRKILIGILTFSLVGSLYLVTYPSVAARLVYSDSDLQTLAEDPNVRRFAEYKVDLSQNSQTSGMPIVGLSESGTTSAGADVVELLNQHRIELKDALTATKLPPGMTDKIGTLRHDQSQFEGADCSLMDSVVPPKCSISPTGGEVRTVALLGDSKMAMFAQPIIGFFKKKGWGIDPLVMSGCTPSAPSNAFQKNCKARMDWVSEKVAQSNYDVIVLAEYPSFPVSREGANYQQKLFNNLKTHSKHLIILKQMTQIPDPEKCIGRDFTYTQACLLIAENENQNLTNMMRFYDSLVDAKTFVIDANQWYVVGQLAPIVFNNTFVFRDGVHLTNSFVSKLNPIIDATLEQILINNSLNVSPK